MPESPDKETIQNLLRIGELKNGLPMNQRGWCNDLGLFVQFHEGQMLEAGGKFRKKIRLVNPDSGGVWKINFYRPGDWEGLVSPTFELARWVAHRRGVPANLTKDVNGAVERFKSGGEMKLPLGSRTMGGPLAVAAGANLFNGMPYCDFEPSEDGLRAWVSANPLDATGWDAFRASLFGNQKFREALIAGNKAIELAPDDGDINVGVAWVYFVAAMNLGSRGKDWGMGLDFKGCTFDVLQCTETDAATAFHSHLRIAANSLVIGAEEMQSLRLMHDATRKPHHN